MSLIHRRSPGIGGTIPAPPTITVYTFAGGGSGGSQVNRYGGGGGAGVQFVPPFTPCLVDQVRVYIAANNNQVGFSVLVLDDDGVDGSPLTVLDSVYVDPVNVVVGSWNNVTLTAPIQINSGSFYVAWMMAGGWNRFGCPSCGGCNCGKGGCSSTQYAAQCERIVYDTKPGAPGGEGGNGAAGRGWNNFNGTLTGDGGAGGTSGGCDTYGVS